MIDLHCHSTFSDGSDSPERLLDLAAEAGCTAIALTDHDTVDGLDRARARADAVGVRFIAGLELSSHLPDRHVHLLGYFLDTRDPQLAERLAGQRKLRDGRNARLVERLNELGKDISIDDVRRHAGAGSVGRPHVAAALVERGYATSINDAFNRFLGEGATAFVERRELTAEEGIRWITEAGGVAVWAHPLTPLKFRDADLTPQLERLSAAGLGGLECWYGRYDNAQRRRLARAAEKHGLVATGGSDYHGTYKIDLRLGTGRGDLAVPPGAADELAARATSSSHW